MIPAALPVAGAWTLAIAVAVVLPRQPLAGIIAVAAAALSGLGLLFVRPLVVVLAGAALLLGVARVELSAAGPPVEPAVYVGHEVAVDGTVVDDPAPRAAGLELLVKPRVAEVDGTPIADVGNFVLEVKQSAKAVYGDEVQAYGRLRLPADRPGFDRRAYLLQRQVHLEVQAASVSIVGRGPRPRQLPGAFREWYRATVAKFLPAPDAALLVGIVLGVKSGIPPHLQSALVATGLVHLLVLSGLKVAVFARLVTALLAPLLGRFAFWPGIAVVTGYAIVGGATPAAVRAAAMGALALIARRTGRTTHVWTSLAVVAAAMLGWHPELAWDVGFQLSFAGTGAIVLLTPPIERAVHWVPHLLREPFAVTAAAQIGTAPFMAADFHLVSVVAPVANALTLPLLPVLVTLGILLAPLSAVPWLAELIAIVSAGMLAFVRQVAELCASLPLASVSLPSFPAGSGAAYYGALAAGMVAVRSSGRQRLAALACSALVPIVIAVAELASWNFAGQTANVLSVGDGQAVLFEGPQGAILVDGGGSPAKLADELGQRLPPWQRQLTALAITAPTKGHVGGLAAFRYSARSLLLPATPLQGSAWRNAAWLTVAGGAAASRLVAGEHLRLAGFDVEVLAPEPTDPGDVVGAGYLALRVVSNSGASFCDLSDLDADAQAVVAQRLPGRCDHLLLPLGGGTAPSPDLLRAARPRDLVASLATGRIAPELATFVVRRTDQEGTIVLDL